MQLGQSPQGKTWPQVYGQNSHFQPLPQGAVNAAKLHSQLACLFIYHLSIYLPIYHLFVYLSVCLSVYLSV